MRVKRTEVVYEFGPFRLDAAERRLLRDGQPVELRAKVFDTLLVLLENHGHLVEKDQLLKAIWPDSVVEESNLAHNLAVLRKALGEKAGGGRHIQTVPAKGYRFIAEVRVVEGAARAMAQAAGSPLPYGGWEERLESARAAVSATSGAGPAASSSHRHVVGRQRELADMFAALESAALGQGLVLSIAGEPGIGKSTLVDCFLRELAGRQDNYVAAVGSCSERLAGSEAYLPLLEALGALLVGPAGEAVSELMKIVAPTWYVQIAPLWASADPSFAAVCADAKMASRERMKRELVALFEEIARIRPLVVFLDDLHWADASTVDLLAYLSRRLASMRALVVVAYRPSEMILGRHPFIAVRQELQRQNLCREVEIGLLGLEEVANYLALEIPRDEAQRGLAEVIYRRTEGNPFFMADLVRHLRERGRLGESVDSMEQDLPASVRNMIQRRIDQLDQDELALLAAASVQGYEFDAGIVADILKLDAATVEARLRRLDRGHSFVRYLDEKELPDGSLAVRYAFAHSLYQHAIDDTLTPTQRIALSKSSGEALLWRYGTSPAAVASQLALLFETARDFERAADFFVAAAGNAARLLANEEAVHLSRRAIVNADKLQGTARHSRVLAATLQLAQLHLVLSRFADAVADFELAEKAAIAMGDIDAQVNAICSAAMAHFNQIHLDAARQYAERALALAHTTGSEVGAASAELVLGMERMCLGITGEAKRRFDRATPVLARHGPPLHALEAVGYSGLLHAWQLEYKSAGDAVDWCLQKARELDLSYYIIMNLFVRGMARFNQGRLSEGLRDLNEGMRLAEKNGERFWLSRFPNTLGWVYRELQDFETALRFDTDGARAARENGYGKPEANAHVNLAADYIALGEPQRAGDHLRRAGEIFEADVWFRWRYNIRTKAELARYSLARGDSKEAARQAAESVALAAPPKARKHLARAHKILGDAAVAEERFGDARQEYDKALRILERHRCPTIEWTVLLAASDMASALRDTDLAEGYRGRCRQVIRHLADSLIEDSLRQKFLASEAIRRALK